MVFYPQNPLFNFLSTLRLSFQQKAINVTSDTSKFSVNLTNKNKLQFVLEELNFWKPNAIATFSTQGQQGKDLVTVRSLNIHLTDKKQALGNVTDPNTHSAYEGYGMKYNTRDLSLDLYIFIDSSFYSKESANVLGTYFSYMLFYALYDITHPIINNNQLKRLVGIDEYISKNINMVSNKTFFIMNFNK